MTDAPSTPESSGGLPEDRLEILRLVENGLMSVEEASRILETLDRADRISADPLGFAFGNTATEPISPPRPSVSPPPPPAAMRGAMPAPRNVRIRISEDGETQLNLVIPFGLIDSGLKLAKRFAPESLLDSRDIRTSIEEGFVGPLLDIYDDGQHVEILIEARQ
ncbi:MAG: hypothetical protein QM589_07410 [Thermomicrobiales bacterium]